MSFNTIESTTGYKENVSGIYFDEFLIGMFSSSFWGNIDYCSFQ